MVLEDQLQNPLYRNWVKSGLALKYLKCGLQNFVDNEVKTLHEAFLADIGTILGLTPINCGQCTTENVLSCPTKGFCHKKGRQCAFHDSTNPAKKTTACPNNICGRIYKKIIDQHRYGSPCWKNTNALKWCTDHWEIAKCYIDSAGYKDKTSAVDSDCSGILNVVVNGLFMQNALDSYIDPPRDIFSKNRLARNSIMHSAELEVTDDDTMDHIDNMIDLLKDKKKLLFLQDAMDARKNLDELSKTKTVTITTEDELAIRQEALKAIHEKEQEAIQNLDDKYFESMENINQNKDSVMIDIDEKQTEARDAIIKLCAEQREQMQHIHDLNIDEMDKRLAESEKRIEDYFQRKIDEKLDGFCQQKFKCLQDQIHELKQEFIDCKAVVENIRLEVQTLQQKHCGRIEQLKEYHASKTKLQESLRKMYERHLSQIPISPLLKEVTADVNDVYTELVICDDLINDSRKRKQSKEKKSENKTRVESYKDIFNNGNIPCTKIFILGDAGMGKTTWCMKLVKTWLSSLTKLSNNSDLDEDEKIMSKYEFVFFISLRHVESDRSISDMIKSQIFSTKRDLMAITNAILDIDSDKCLVIMDGLDEWSCPDQEKTIDKTGLPLRNELHNCTILTTSRPWKITSLCLIDTEIDRAVKIKGLTRENIKKLTTTIIQKLNKRNGKNKNSNRCIEDMESTNRNIMEVPLMLISMVCLWYENDSIEKLLANVYSELVEILIKYAEGNEPHILALGKLAFYGLFATDKEACLVFNDKSILEYLNEDEQKKTLKIGILSVSKCVENVIERNVSFSFLHKTMQEYFAAVYMVSGDDDHKSKCIATYKSYCKTAQNVFELEHLFLFICGMCPSMASDISKHISTVSPAVIKRSMSEDDYSFVGADRKARELNTYLLRCDEQKCLVSPEENQIYIKRHYLNWPDKTDYKFKLDVQELANTLSYLQKYGHQNTYSVIVTKFVPAEFDLHFLCEYLKREHNINEIEISCFDEYTRFVLSGRFPQTVFDENTFTILKHTLQNMQCINKLCLEGMQINGRDIYDITNIVLELSNQKSLKSIEYTESNIPIVFSSSHIEDVYIKNVSEHVTCQILKCVKHALNLKSLKIANEMTRELNYFMKRSTKYLPIDLSHSDKLHYLTLGGLMVASIKINPTSLCEIKLQEINFLKQPDTLTALQQCRKLTKLHCEKTSFGGNLDLSENTELTFLKIVNVTANTITLPNKCIREMELRELSLEMIQNLQNQSQVEKLTVYKCTGKLVLSCYESLTMLNLVPSSDFHFPIQNILGQQEQLQVELPPPGRLKNVNIGQDSFSLKVLQDLKSHAQIEKLAVRNCFDCSVDYYQMYYSKPRSEQKQHLRHIMNATKVEYMVKILPIFIRLETINLENIDFSTQTLVISQKMEKLKELNIENCQMTTGSFKSFVLSLKDLKQSVKVTYKGRDKFCSGVSAFIMNCLHIKIRWFSNDAFGSIKFYTC